jgi:hypothetical protein
VIPQRQFQVVAFDDSLPYQRSVGLQEGQGAEDHSARSAAYVRLAGGLGRGQCACTATHARTHISKNDAGHLRRPLRRRFRRCRGHSACPVLTGKCAQNVPTTCPRRATVNMKTAIYQPKRPHRISAGRGTRTLSALVLTSLKGTLAAETHHSHSRSIAVSLAQVWAKCGHARLVVCDGRGAHRRNGRRGRELPSTQTRAPRSQNHDPTATA